MSTEKLTYSRVWTDAEAFPRLGFTKNWENPEDYPTIETDEAKVREDMQSLHDETKDYINDTLIPAILAEDATEEARIAAESTREENERSRVQAEQTRVSHENARIQAEAAREAKVYEKFPYVGENGNWQEWDENAGAFVDSGVQAQGQRGTGILKVITEPKEVTGTVWLWFSRSKVLSESGASEVLVGDIVQHESNHYLVDEVTSSNVYIRTVPTSIKGAAGKSAYEYAQEGGYPGTEAEFRAKLATEYADADLGNVSLEDLVRKVVSTSAFSVFPVITELETEDGVAFTATVPGITSMSSIPFALELRCVSMTHSSSSTEPTLNINGLGAYTIKQYNGSLTGGSPASSANWLRPGAPVSMVFDGLEWLAFNYALQS